MKLNTKPLKNIPLGIPVVSDGIYYAVMTAEIKRNKADTNNNLIIRYKIIDPQITLRETGEMIDNPNNAIVTRYVAFARGDEDVDGETRFNRQVKELACAATGMSENDLDDIELEDLNDKIVKVKIAFEAGTGGFPDKNVAKFTSPLAEGEEPPSVAF